MVRREMKKNIRVWLQDGAEDQENARAGSWPLANIEMANSLKLKGDDYHFSFGFGDPSQEFVQDPAEKDLPLWRVVTLNRN